METGESKGVDIFSKYYEAALGIGVALLGCVALFFIGWLLVWGCIKGYNRWFSDIEGYEIGYMGLVYDCKSDRILKTYPHRTIISNVERLYDYRGDSIGVIVQKGKYGLLNLNTAQYIVSPEYDNLWKSSEDNCFAVMRDTLYTIGMFDGEIKGKKYLGEFYYDVHPFYLGDESDIYVGEEDYSIDESKILLYEYSDYKGRKGLMNKDLVPITPALYSRIYPLKSDVYFCQFYGNDGGAPGILLNDKGERIK